jgi:hypothetical protein
MALNASCCKIIGHSASQTATSVNIVKFEVFTAKTMKNDVFWDVMPRDWVPPKRRFLQEPHGVKSQKTPFFQLHSLLLWRKKHSRKIWKQIKYPNLHRGASSSTGKCHAVMNGCHVRSPSDAIHIYLLTRDGANASLKTNQRIPVHLRNNLKQFIYRRNIYTDLENLWLHKSIKWLSATHWTHNNLGMRWETYGTGSVSGTRQDETSRWRSDRSHWIPNLQHNIRYKLTFPFELKCTSNLLRSSVRKTRGCFEECRLLECDPVWLF